MKFLSLRTVYRVFPIIKHSKLWDHALSRPLVLLTWNFKHLFVSSSTINMPNFIEIGWEIREKSRNADGGKEKKERIKNNKKQNKNRKVFRLCRQTLNKEKTIQQQKGLPTLSADLNERALAGNSNHKYQFNSKITRLQCMEDGYQMRTGLEAEGGCLRVRTCFFFLLFFFFLTSTKRRDSTFGYVWMGYFLELNL